MPEALRVKLLTATAVPPKRADSDAAGYDIRADMDGSVPSGGQTEVRTGLALTVPKGTYGRIAPRSGLAKNHGIHVMAGVIDRSYTGEVIVLLRNLGRTSFPFKRGDRIAQLILESIVTPDVEVVDNLEATGRGSGGFGSSGMS